ncbi:CPBP family intramembrane metalloprotease [Pontiellaceae bacterium B12227]|nr:CPBP family intramembrane metalloprotease [Pontiellaceae bacterium B12227]
MNDLRGFFRTLKLLLINARRRAAGRAYRQRQLMNQRTGSTSDSLRILGFIGMLLVMAMVHCMAGYSVQLYTQEAQRYDAEQQGSIVVSKYFHKRLVEFKNSDPDIEWDLFLKKNDYWLESEAEEREEAYGGTEREHRAFLEQAVQERPLKDFASKGAIRPGLKTIETSNPFALTVGSTIFIWWLMMLIFQGEGLELDIQRRRHPMWEWLLSHPVHPGAVFLAEMLAPITANPAYLAAPLFSAVLFGVTYGAGYGALALPMIGLPLTVAAACFGKSLEIFIMLRSNVRKRGAIIGLMSWFGYAAFILFLFGLYAAPRIVNLLGLLLYDLSQTLSISLILPIIGKWGGISSFWLGMLCCWLLTALLIGSAVLISVRATRKGLSGNTGSNEPAAAGRGEKWIVRLGRDPLYRKELLWFLRDRSAIIQVFLVPLTIAGAQLFNLRRVLAHADNAWHTLSGTAVLFGTYFLWILGPKSLTSEGAALWIAQTWPRGMEDLLKAKARLWFMISSLVVGIILLFAAVRFPSDLWKLSLIALGWAAFGRSMAEKCVTLVSVTKESGETEKIPAGRRMAAALGMLTFGIGVLTQQWHLAITGIVYSWITAAAMWQNFRARLPYLYDPWAEKVPPAPTVMHAMIAISVLIELGAVFTGIFTVAAKDGNMMAGRMISYAIISLVVMFVTMAMMADRYLQPRDTWSWSGSVEEKQRNRWIWCGDHSHKGAFFFSCILGVFIGLLWGVSANGYVQVLGQFDTFSETFQTLETFLQDHHNTRVIMFVVAVLFAPLAEEYLFRGLLFRALDREWGGWKALLGSAAFFAIYHPPMAWLPVGLMGLFNALLFKKTGRLAPCVLLHMVYNAVVLAW